VTDPEVAVFTQRLPMYPVFFNLIGLAMGFTAIVLAGVLDAFLGTRVAFISVGLALVAADLIYRSRRGNLRQPSVLFHPERGGQVMFIPIWAFGALALALGVLT